MRVLELVCGQISGCFCRFKFWDWPMEWWRCVILDTFCYNLVRLGDQTWFQYLNDVRQCSWSIARFYTWFFHLVMCISSTQVNIIFIGEDRFRMFHVDDLLPCLSFTNMFYCLCLDDFCIISVQDPHWHSIHSSSFSGTKLCCCMCWPHLQETAVCVLLR